MNPATLLTTYQRSAKVLLANLDDLTHAQSLWIPAPNVNSINWLAGHLVSSRTSVLKQLGQAEMWDEEARARYKGGSAPIFADEPGVFELSKIAADFMESQARIEAGLNVIAPEALDAPSISPRFTTVGDHLLYLNVHEIHHIGQIMTVRELLGKPSVWA